MKRNEVKFGAILSYALIFFNAIYGLVIAPYVLSTIGTSEYGVYKTIGSMTISLTVLELGIGGTLQRYIAKFNALNLKKEATNFSAMGMIQALALSLVMLFAGVGLFFSIDGVYGDSFTAAELVRAKQIFILQLVYVVFHIYENALFGIIAGYNRFVFSNSIKLGTIFLKILLYFVFLPIFKNSLVIVLISLILEFSIIFLEIIYIKFVNKHKIHLYKWDKALFKESFLYTILLFVQSLIIQFNGNIDNIVIGAVVGTTAVTIYSFALQIYNMYETCATAISGVILPTVTKQIYSGATTDELEDTVEKYGRVQWMFLGAALFGFLCCGKEFFYVWLGEGYSDCWYLAVILMIPVTFPLIVNVCLAILKAKNLLKFRTISMIYSVVINIIFTVIGTRIWGYWAAAVGTTLYTIVGSVISMNIYYNKKLGINMFGLYFKIFHKTTLGLIVASIPCILLNWVMYGSWLSFIIKVGIFVAVYGAVLLLYALKPEEKRALGLKRRQKA